MDQKTKPNVCPNCQHDEFDEDGDCRQCREPGVVSPDNVNHAVEFARRGWRVFPCKPRKKTPATNNGFKDGSSDLDTVKEMFSGWPEDNIGVATGPGSGFWVLDVDGAKGVKALGRLEKEHGKLPNTVSVRTGGGGRHLFFTCSETEVRNRTKIGGNPIDVRGAGGYVVVPPSRHPNGKTYTWEHDPDSTPIADAPGWLVDFVTGNGTKFSPLVRNPLTFTIGGELDLAGDPGASKGNRHDRALRLIGAAIGAGVDLVEAARQAVEWGRRCSPALPDEEVLRIVSDLGRKHGTKATTVLKKRLPDPPTPWQPFPVDALPEPVRSYVQAGANAMKCDSAYIALPLLAGLASAIGATRRIKLKSGWSEPSVVWVATVGESGTLKSPAQSYALDALRRAQEWQLDQYPSLVEQYERDKLLYEADLGTWKKQGRAKGEPPPEKPGEPKVGRYIVSDITVEALADRLQDAPRGVLLASDELAVWLGSFNAYRSGRGADAARWLSIHRAESLLVDRKSGDRKTIFVKRAAVSVAGSIQPGTLRRALGNEHIENGLAARLLVAYPPRHNKRWNETTVSPVLIRTVERIYGRLLALDFTIDDNEAPVPADVPLSPAGKEAWVSFYDEFAKLQEEASGPVASAYSKIEGYAARLALIDHLVRHAADDPDSADSIDERSIQAGVTLAKWFADEAQRVYAILGETDEQRQARQVVEFIRRRGGTITANDLRRRSRHLETSEDAESLLGSLVEAGLGTWKNQPPDEAGGRPTRYFRLNEVSPYPKPVQPPSEKGVSDTDTEDTPRDTGSEEFTI